MSCQPDEVYVIRPKKQVQTVNTLPPTTIAEENKDCPRCEGNTYCNRKTGKCEGQAVSPVKRDQGIDKPVSSTAFYWQDKGETHYY